MCVVLLSVFKGLLLFLLCKETQVASTQDTSLDKRNTSVTGYWNWDVSDWSVCKYSKPGSQSSCVRRRTVTCVFTEDWSVVPPFYCHRFASDTQPDTEETCYPCQRPCILSGWKPWSQCSCGEKFRQRSVLYLPPEGDVEQCGATVEKVTCEGENSTCDKDYKWKHGEWSSCQMVNTQDGNSTEGSSTQETVSENTDFTKNKKRKKCPAGVRSRHVYCSHLSTLTQVDQQFCSHYTSDSRPESSEPCSFPCSCLVSEWESWSPCTISCTRDPTHTGYQSRRRHVTMKPSPGGASCPVLEHTRQCPTQDVPLCERYEWKVSEWEECKISDGRTPQCGSGFQSRSVHCSKDTTDETITVEVDDEFCLNDTVLIMRGEMRPAEVRSCTVPCPTDCQTGEWQNWSSCTKSCGSGGTRIRTKPAVLKAVHGGTDCKQEYETKECEEVSCYWWHTGQWSACFLDNIVSTCGQGSQVRNVYCMSALDEAVVDDLCVDLYGLAPTAGQICQVPCEDQCSLTEWSDWSQCSVTCGAKGGNQRRTRQIEGQKFGEAPCVPEDQLEQVRSCNQIPCRLFLWQVGPWSECQASANVTADSCVETTPGLRTRQAYCQLNYGFPADESFCEGQDIPILEENCTAPCPVDCKLGKPSEWSPCSKTCGRDSLRQRRRPVLQLSAHGGFPCPNKTIETGYATETRRCRNVPKCHIYEWSVGNWSTCQLTTAECGFGYKTRTVACFRNGHRKITPEHCLGEEPEGEARCFEPCSGDCEMTHWTKWSPCPKSCSDEPVDHFQTRTREFMFQETSSEAFERCYNLTSNELVNRRQCKRKSCPTYSWRVGNWSSCIPHNNMVCGSGSQMRNVVCNREDGVDVGNHMCESRGIPVPEFTTECEIPCTLDCQLSEWSEWSSCSSICGYGLSERTRVIANEEMYGGRTCPEVTQQSLCMETDCDLLQWSISEWSNCKPNYDMPCGSGVMTRLVDCVAGDKCAAHHPKPPTYMDCDVPCLGDCVMSQWSDWSQCSCSENSTESSTRERTRSVLTEPLPSAEQCKKLEETEQCSCFNYEKQFLNWTSCKIKDGRVCGIGKKSRAMTCVRSDGVPVALIYCGIPSHESVEEEESCLVECLVDCEVTTFGPWSSCSQTCGLESQRMRWSQIKTPAHGGGRQCPSQENLKQVQPCDVKICYSYQWHTEEWGDCSVDEALSCGQGSKKRKVTCKRSDLVAVDHSYCNITLLGEPPKSEKMCGIPCPLDCVITEWSVFGPCFNSCGIENDPLQFRSRSVIQADSPGGRECPEQLINSRKCALSHAVCPVAHWKVESWRPNGLRNVYCSLPSGHQVSEGCFPDEKPSEKKQCERFYDCEEYSECVDGQCVCVSGFIEVNGVCLPEFGCISTLHCVANSSSCDMDSRNCVCYDGSLPIKGVFCSGSPLEPKGGSEINYMFLFVLIGIMCLLLLIALLIVMALLRRKKKKTYYSPAPASLSKIDNLDNMKNNQKQKQESPLLLKHQYGMSSVNELEKAPTPTYPSNFTYNYDVINKDGSPALIGGMKKRKNKLQLLSVDGHVYDEGETVPKSSEANDEVNQLRADEPLNHINGDSPSGDWKPLLPPSSPTQYLQDNPMTTFKPNELKANVPQNAMTNSRPSTLPLEQPNGNVPRYVSPSYVPRHEILPKPKPKPLPKPQKLVLLPPDGYATMPLQTNPLEVPHPIASNTSPRGPPRSKNPASARLLEYCDELLAELEHMAKH